MEVRPLLTFGTAFVGFLLSVRATHLDTQLNPDPRRDYFCIFRHVDLWGSKLYYHSMFYYFLISGLSWLQYHRTILPLSGSFLSFQLYVLQRLTRRQELCSLCIILPLTHVVFIADSLLSLF